MGDDSPHEGPLAPPPAPPNSPSFAEILWKVLDGNKTFLGTVFWVLPDILTEAQAALVQLGVPSDKVSKVIGSAFITVGLIHKIVKIVRTAQAQ